MSCVWMLQRGHSGDGCVLASTLGKYDLRKGDLFVLSWARVRRVRRGSISSEGSKRHSLQAVELSQRTQAAVQIVSNLPAPSNGGPIYRFLGMPAMRTHWMAGAAAHKSG